MTAIPLGSNVYGFALSGTVISLGSAPNVGDLDVLAVNSDTTVSTPASSGAPWLLAPSNVGGQGTYMFRRIATGGEGSSVTIVTAGNFDTQASWSRWGNVNAADMATIDTAGGAATTSPAHSTGTLAQVDELSIAFSAMHTFASAPSSPVWAAPYTPLTTNSQGQVAAFVAYNLHAGTAPDTPSVSWTNAATDRDMATLTFTTFALPTALPPIQQPTRRRAFTVKVRRRTVAGPLLLGGHGSIAPRQHGQSRRRPIRPGRVRVGRPPLDQLAPPPAAARRRPPRQLPVRRTHIAQPPFLVVALAPPLIPTARRPRTRPALLAHRRRTFGPPLVGAAPPPVVNDFTFTAGEPTVAWHVRRADLLVAWTAGPPEIDWEATT